MTELLPDCSASVKRDAKQDLIEADFASAEAIFDDYRGRPMPPAMAEFMFWPWEVALLRLHAEGELRREAAVKAWGQLMATSALIARAANFVRIDARRVGLRGPGCA